MTKQEILHILNYKTLNEKCNNYVFANFKGKEISEVITNINPICKISNPTEDVKYSINTTEIPNMIVDASSIKVEDLLNETLSFLEISSSLKFEDKMSLLRFKGLLRRYEKAVQWIILNAETLSLTDQMQLNEIFYFNTYFFNVNVLLTSSDLVTYRLKSGIYLDNRENYEKIKVSRY